MEWKNRLWNKLDIEINIDIGDIYICIHLNHVVFCALFFSATVFSLYAISILSHQDAFRTEIPELVTPLACNSQVLHSLEFSAETHLHLNFLLHLHLLDTLQMNWWEDKIFLEGRIPFLSPVFSQVFHISHAFYSWHSN